MSDSPNVSQLFSIKSEHAIDAAMKCNRCNYYDEDDSDKEDLDWDKEHDFSKKVQTYTETVLDAANIEPVHKQTWIIVI